MPYCCLMLTLFSATAGLAGQAPRSPSHQRLVIAGTLVTIHRDSISIKSDHGTFVVRVNSDTKIWRGGPVDLHDLRLGDDVYVAYHAQEGNGEMVAVDITANIANWHGTITKIGPDGISIATEDEQGNPSGRATIFIDGHTTYYGGSPKDLQVGGWLRALGLDLGNDRMRATRVWLRLGK